MCSQEKSHGVKGGWSIDKDFLDPVTKRRYDLRIKKDQNEVRRLVKRDRPLTLIVSPPCTLFSIANQRPLDPKDLEEAKELMSCAAEMCTRQHKAGRHFVLEQPLTSRAWSLEPITKLMMTEGVISTEFHQCMYGLTALDHQGVAPAYKPTSVLTNHSALAEVLQERCNGKHRHAQLIGKSACTQAACYPPRLCAAVVKGIQVIKGKLEELSSARRMIKEACQCVPGNLASVTSAGSHGNDLAIDPEDVLYELELEDMCEEDPSTWENLANQ